MNLAKSYASGGAAGLFVALLAASSASAGTTQYCVKCTDPDQTYLCNVETPNLNASEQGLQLYCIVRTSKEGGHRSCAVDASSAANCVGPVKTYTFIAPKIPENVRDALNRYRSSQDGAETEEALPPQKGGEPKTLIDLTRRSVGASKEGLKDAGEAVGTTKEKVGGAARGVGRGVAKAAGKVGSATKKTGQAVGGAAKTAWDCVKSLFKDCTSSE